MSEVHSIWFVIEYVQQYNDAVIEAIRRSYSRNKTAFNVGKWSLCPTLFGKNVWALLDINIKLKQTFEHEVWPKSIGLCMIDFQENIAKFV